MNTNKELWNCECKTVEKHQEIWKQKLWKKQRKSLKIMQNSMILCYSLSVFFIKNRCISCSQVEATLTRKIIWRRAMDRSPCKLSRTYQSMRCVAQGKNFWWLARPPGRGARSSVFLESRSISCLQVGAKLRQETVWRLIEMYQSMR